MSDMLTGDEDEARPTPPEETTPTRGRWGRFSARLIEVCLRPTRFFERMRDGDAPQLTEILWPHVVILALAAALAQSLNLLLRGHAAVLGLMAFVSSLLGAFALVVGLGLVFAIIGRAQDGQTTSRRALALAAYGLSPLFVVGLLGLVPIPGVATAAQLLAMPVAFVAIGAGVVPCARVPDDRAVRTSALMAGALLVVWSLLQGLALAVFAF